MIIVSF